MKVLLQAGADVNKPNTSEMTPLMVIANDRGNKLGKNVENRLGIAQILLQNGANLRY